MRKIQLLLISLISFFAPVNAGGLGSCLKNGNGVAIFNGDMASLVGKIVVSLALKNGSDLPDLFEKNIANKNVTAQVRI